MQNWLICLCAGNPFPALSSNGIRELRVSLSSL